MKKLFLFVILAMMILATGCKSPNAHNSDDDKPVSIIKEKLSGYAEKGPFASGSKVTISELDNNLNQTGRIFETLTTNDDGYFEINDVELKSKYIQVSIDGYYLNEVNGQLSDSQITLWSICNVQSKNKINANVLTHLIIHRLKHLVSTEKMSFDKAKQKAEQELLKCFGITEAIQNFESASILNSDNESDVLLALSYMLLSICNYFHATSDARLTQLLSLISTDIAQDGVLNNRDTMNEILNIVYIHSNFNPYFNPNKAIDIKQKLQNYYLQQGKTIDIGNFERYYNMMYENLIGNASLSATPETNTISWSECEVNFKIQSATDWTITGMPDWCILSQTTGRQGITEIKVNFAHNEYVDERQAILLIENEDEKKTITFKQSGYIRYLELLPGNKNLSISSDEQVITIAVASSDNWIITGMNDWCEVSQSNGRGTQIIDVNISENNTNQTRDIELFAECGEGDRKIVKSLHISQTTWSNRINVSPTAFDISESSQTIEITVTGVEDHLTGFESDFITIDPAQCIINTDGSLRIPISIDENLSIDRYEYIRFHFGSYGQQKQKSPYIFLRQRGIEKRNYALVK